MTQRGAPFISRMQRMLHPLARAGMAVSAMAIVMAMKLFVLEPRLSLFASVIEGALVCVLIEAFFRARGRAAAGVEMLREIHARTALALQESEHVYALIFDTSPVAMYVLDPVSGRFVTANEAALRLYGYSREEFLGLSVGDLSAMGDDLDEGHHRTCDGSIIHADVITRDICFEGEPRRLVAAIDRTERERLEMQLRQAQKMDAIGRLAGGVAHDFNNMLTVILGFTWSLLEDTKESDPTYSALDEIRRAAERSANLTQQLLAFSRQQPQRARVVDLNEVIASTEVLVRRLVGEGVHVVTHFSPTLCKTEVDPTQIEQILMNLVVNARDAMGTSGKLSIETSMINYDNDEVAEPRSSMRPGRYVKLAIADTGSGMDPTTQLRIFEPFFTTKPVGKGTGLGLAIVFGIVKQCGGHIRVDSVMGRGTMFELYFPASDQETDVAVRQTTAPASILGTETILLVEDDEQVLKLIDVMLRRNGYCVLTARHPGEAIVLCEQHAGVIDLLITDVIMPQMDGRALAERLTQTRPEMKVLFMSGYTNNVFADRADVPFVQKPVLPYALGRKIRAVLRAEPAYVAA